MHISSPAEHETVKCISSGIPLTVSCTETHCTPPHPQSSFHKPVFLQESSSVGYLLNPYNGARDQENIKTISAKHGIFMF